MIRAQPRRTVLVSAVTTAEPAPKSLSNPNDTHETPSKPRHTRRHSLVCCQMCHPSGRVGTFANTRGRFWRSALLGHEQLVQIVARACLLYRWVMFRQTEVHGSPVEVYAVHERAVGASRSATPLQRGPERPSVRRQSPGGRGHCLPVSDRDPVAGSPRAVRSVADSVEAAPSIRRRWHLGSRADADPCRGRRCR